MSDFFAPSYWYGAGPNFSGLSNAYAQQAQNANYFANQQAVMRQAQAYNPWANSGGSFGVQPAAYAAAGAAYGRNTSSLGGSIDARIQAARAYNAQRTGQTYNAPRQYGWDANEGAAVPSPYRAPMQYGWGHNEGAPVPKAPAYTPPMGQFRPQTYGWDHNEGMGSLFNQGRYIGGGPANMLSPQPMGPMSGSATDGPGIYGPGMYANSPFGTPVASS